MLFIVHNFYLNFFFIYRILCAKNPAAVTSFEVALFQVFQGILQQDIQGNCYITIGHICSKTFCLVR